jgi:ADP-ribosylglycohydrolase
LSKEELKDKILGVLYGNAIGDAIGLATEFMSKEQAHFEYDRKVDFDNFEKEFLQDRHRSNWQTG